MDSAGVPQGRVPLLVRMTGAEVGARMSTVPGPVNTWSLFYLQSDSGLTSDATRETPSPTGRHTDMASSGPIFCKPTPWLALSADASYTYARYLHLQDSVDGGSSFNIANSFP